MSWNLYLLVGVILMAIGIGLWYMLSRLLSALKPGPGDIKRYCPHCGQEFEETRRYCQACGGQIWDDVLPER